MTSPSSQSDSVNSFEAAAVALSQAAAAALCHGLEEWSENSATLGKLLDEWRMELASLSSDQQVIYYDLFFENLGSILMKRGT